MDGLKNHARNGPSTIGSRRLSIHSDLDWDRRSCGWRNGRKRDSGTSGLSRCTRRGWMGRVVTNSDVVELVHSRFVTMHLLRRSLHEAQGMYLIR